MASRRESLLSGVSRTPEPLRKRFMNFGMGSEHAGGEL